MKKIKFSKRIIILILLILSIGVIGEKYFSEKYQQAKNSEAVNVLESFAGAQESYFGTYKEYSKDKMAVGYSPDLQRVTTYFNKEDIPESYLSKIQSTAIPFSNKDSFKILCLFGNQNEKVKEVWTIDNLRNVVHVGSITVE